MDVGEIDRDLLDKLHPMPGPMSRVWEPREVSIVLGRSCDPEREIQSALCLQDGIRIHRRSGGGCAIVLAPGMVVFSIAYTKLPYYSAVDHLQYWSKEVQRSLGQKGVHNLRMQGTSDLCIGNKKVFGSCLYKSKLGFLFQSVLLVDCELNLIERYLKLPPRMPSYREGRPHRSFVTSLREEGCPISCDEVLRHLLNEFVTFP